MMFALAVAALSLSVRPIPIRTPGQTVGPASIRTPGSAAAPQMLFGGQPKGDPVTLEIKTFNGQIKTSGVAGGPMSKSMGSSGIIYGCKEGNCGSCEVKMDGRNVRPCVAKLPKKAVVKVDITSNAVLKSRKQSNF
jgi:hypothetical protein